jgi:hypothetical protein
MQMLDFYVFVIVIDVSDDIDLLLFLICFICLVVRFGEVSVALLYFFELLIFVFF